MRNSEQGMSLMMVIITIIMMLIIISFAIFSSQNMTQETRLATAYASLGAVKEACEEASVLIELHPETYSESYFFGQSVQEAFDNDEREDLLKRCGIVEPEIGVHTYFLDQADKDLWKRLEMSDVSRSYVVDLDHQKYYLVDGEEHMEGEIIHEYEEFVKAYQLLTEEKNG